MFFFDAFDRALLLQAAEIYGLFVILAIAISAFVVWWRRS